MISLSPGGPGSSAVREQNRRLEPGLTRARTDPQHVRGPSPPLAFNVCRRGTNLTPGDSPRHLGARSVSSLGSVRRTLMDTLRGTNLDLRSSGHIGSGRIRWSDPDLLPEFMYGDSLLLLEGYGFIPLKGWHVVCFVMLVCFAILIRINARLPLGCAEVGHWCSQSHSSAL